MELGRVTDLADTLILVLGGLALSLKILLHGLELGLGLVPLFFGFDELTLDLGEVAPQLDELVVHFQDGVEKTVLHPLDFPRELGPLRAVCHLPPSQQKTMSRW